MKHTWKQSMAFLLSLVMVFSLFPVTALAVGDGTEESPEAQINETAYPTLADAMEEAEEGETVQLLTDAEESYVIVQSGVTLDLNGCTLTAKNIVAFNQGQVIDSTDGAGLLKVSKGSLSSDGEESGYLPVYDSEAEGYRLYAYTFQSERVWGTSESKASFTCSLRFENGEAWNAIYEDDDSVSLGMEIPLPGKTTTFESAAALDGLAAAAAKNPTGTWYYTLTIIGLESLAGQTLQVTPILSNTKLLEDRGETLTYDIPGANPDVPPVEGGDGDISVEISGSVDNGQLKEDVSLEGGDIKATVPAGTTLEDGAEVLTLTVAPMESTVEAGDQEEAQSFDIHMKGVSSDNTAPIVVELGPVLPIGLNWGNVTLYHVEDGEAVAMTRVDTLDELDQHNEFWYEPSTGDVVVAMATFSEVALVMDTIPAWEGKFDYTWYDANAESLTIANADQLAAFGAIVGGMKKVTDRNDNGTYNYSEKVIQDYFSGQTVKLISDINLGDDEENNKSNLIFYPIGYYNTDGTYERTNKSITSGFKNFEGIFDGNGHTIANFYQNTWEMKGDNNYYDATLQYYRDGMGLFGKVYGGTVKNLTIENFKSDGEYTTTGCVAAYADGATFENIAIFNCNPRVYNIGNGGIVGCVGWYAKEAGLETTFKNITVDNSNKISALWGSWDVACGGLVGQYYPTSGQSNYGTPKNAGVDFVNCHVSAQIDVYNDVCANYQYYAYRYAGMMIGSVRENVTGEDGHVYPKMDGITASGCTVHFGDWNDYYYCELVANSLASYTHDHQMSRLTQVDSIDTEDKTVTVDGKTTAIPASGRVNYVVVTKKDENGKWIHGDGADYANCYHFVNGVQHKHDVADADNPDIYEVVNGVEVLKEDKQLVYREFNQLFTGYGWGVTSKGLTDYEGIENMDITAGDQEESVDKFKAIEGVDKVHNDVAIKASDLFTYVEACGVEVKADALIISVTDLDNDDGIVTGEFNRANKWEDSTITLTGTGKVRISIQDYHFCKTASIDVQVTERQAAEKFDLVFEHTDDFLYRVGNQNTVKLGSLFEAVEGAEIGTVDVTVEALNGTAASGTYTSNATWTNGTIQFSGTGVVKVAIEDDDTYCTPTELYLEVVDAKNATTATSATANNVVLLNDCGFGQLTVSNGYSLYGNGFTMTCSNDSFAKDMSYSFVELKNGTLDNVQIKCPDFSHAILYAKNYSENDNPNDGDGRYANIRSAVAASGNSHILNSYISGGRAAVFAPSGTLLIENSTIVGGAAANIHVVSPKKITLKDTTLIQEPRKATVHDTSKTLMGFSVVVECDSANTEYVPIVLDGEFCQYAWAHEGYKEYVPTAGQGLVQSTINNNKDYVHEITYSDGSSADSLNLGFAYIWPEGGTPDEAPDAITDNRANVETVLYDYVLVNGMAWIYSYKSTGGTDKTMITTPDYSANTQDPVAPTVTFTDTSDSKKFTTKYDDTNGWMSTLEVDLDATGAYSFSFDNLLAQKYGKDLTYTVKTASDEDVNTVINLDDTSTTEYILTITDDQIYGADGKKTSASATHIYHFKLVATKTSINPPVKVAEPGGTPLLVVKSKNSDWSCAIPALEGTQIKYYNKTNKAYETLSLSSLTPTSTGKQNGTNNFWEYTDVNGNYTLKITSGYIHSGKQIYGMPVVVDNEGNKMYFTISSTNGYVGTGTASRSVTLTYDFTDSNGQTLTFSKTWQFNYADYKDGTQYSYNDFVEGNLKEASGTCVTGDTLITLADGSQARVDSLTGTEELLVWNQMTGALDTAPIAYIIDYNDEAFTEEVITLTYSDGTYLDVITEHVFFDVTENQYVALTSSNAEDFIGHTFLVTNEDTTDLEPIQLVDVTRETRETTIYEVVTYNDLTCFTNGILSACAFLDPLLNIFDVDPDTLAYDPVEMQEDIDTYGLYTYADFEELLPEVAFDLYNAANLKVAVGKGYMTWEDILGLVDLYYALEIEPLPIS